MHAKVAVLAFPATLLACSAAELAAQAPPPSGFPGEAPEGPRPGILSFTAEPESIGAGESTVLRWAAINAYSLTIEPGVGAVATRGSISVAPRAPTAYTLTVTGTGGATTQTVAVEVRGASGRGAGDSGRTVAGPAPTSAEQRGIARLADGKPDLSGVYLGGRGIRMVGAIELVPGAERFRVPPSDEDLGQGALCLPPGVPAATMVPYPLQIVHKPDVVAILYEAYHLFRIIPVGRGHDPAELDPTWMGHSVARWDGDTLVVDVIRFNDRTRIAGHRHTENMRVTERYTRTGYDTIAYEAIVEDANVFAEPIRYAGNLVLHPEWEIGEYVCAENNKDYAELFE